MSSNETLVKKIKLGNDRKELLSELYEQNTGLLWRLCKKYSYRAEMNDLMQQAYIGLHRAALEYDPAAGAAFSTYAATVIQRELERYCCSCWNIIRVSEREKRLYYERERFARYIEATEGRKPTEQEYSQYLGVSVEKVRKMEKLAFDCYVTSLDTPVNGKDGSQTTLAELVPDEGAEPETIIDRIAEDNLKSCLHEEIDSLPGTMQEVTRKKAEGQSIPKIAEAVGIDPGTARAIYTKAIVILRKNARLKRAAAGIYC